MERPILVFGMPRSGTTWLGKIFDSHPDTLYRHEPDTWRGLSIPRYVEAEETDRYATIVQTFTGELPTFNAVRVAGKLPLFPKAYLSRSQAHLMRSSVWLAHLGGRLNFELPVFMHGSTGDYAQRRVVWKSIESLGRVGLVLNSLPAAKAIHVLRHPCGYIASVLRGRRGKRFSDSAAASEDYGIFKVANNTSLGTQYQLSVDKLEMLTPEERMAWRWVLINEKALLESKATGRALCVRYEDICINPLKGTERMFGFTGLEMTDQTRRFLTASTTHTDDRYYSVYKNPETAAMRWQEELPSKTVERVMAIVERSPFARYYSADSINVPEM